MAACSICGTSNPAGAKFCAECAAPLASAPQSRETRRTVTILFADVSGSTSLGEQLDPEALRAVMTRYFAEMRTIVERHGGTVEKFIGDAVMAVFGIPQLHEDDAMRAVRAAAEIGEQLERLNTELGLQRGVAIRFRTGVNTGQVVAGDPASGQTLVTGDAVNTAARLEQAAAPGQIVLGPLTYQLVRDAVTVEPLAPIELKGKAQPLAVYRLLAVTAGAPGHTRRLDAPLVGRESELAALAQAYATAISGRQVQLVTLLGQAGVGKSRLVAEFLASVATDATVVAGRCLPYGEGITYWPLAEAIKMAAGIGDADDRDAATAKVRALVAGTPDPGTVAARIGQAIGLEAGATPQEEIFWAVRKLFESMAGVRPLVVEFDDVQWADETFLDLLEHIAQLARDAPLLVLCPARPELLERRPGWGSGMPQVLTVRLEPLTSDTTGQLIDQLPGGIGLPDALRSRILNAAEGNPLFIEEMVGMLVDERHVILIDGRWQTTTDLAYVTVPPTITALLAARLDQLAPAQRNLAQRASVVGQSFEQAALAELLPAAQRGDMARDLLALVRKELIRPDRAELSTGDAFRFRHLLIRDAAYGALPKAERATLHERFADWLERVTADRLAEYQEIVGHHLGQAHGYRAELGGDDESTRQLGRRAASHLAAAGRRAQTRGDMPGAAALYRGALSLPLVAEERVRIQTQLARALIETGDWVEAAQQILATESTAEEIGDARWKSHAAVLRAVLESETEEHPQHQEIEAVARDAIDVFDACGDELGLSRAWDLLANSAFIRSDLDLAGSAWRTAHEHAQLTQDPAEEARIRTLLPATSIYGWRTTSEALRYCEELSAAADVSPMFRARLLAVMAQLHAMRGELAQSIELRELSRRLLNELAVPWMTAETHQMYAYVDALGGEWMKAEREATYGYEVAVKHGVRQAGNLLYLVVEAALRQGRVRDAAAWLERIPHTPGATDPSVAPIYSMLSAWVAIDEGDRARARAALASVQGESLASLNPLDSREVLRLRGEVLGRLGDWSAAAEDFAAALKICERKELLVEAEVTRRLLAQAQVSAASTSDAELGNLT